MRMSSWAVALLLLASYPLSFSSLSSSQQEVTEEGPGATGAGRDGFREPPSAGARPQQDGPSISGWRNAVLMERTCCSADTPGQGDSLSNPDVRAGLPTGGLDPLGSLATRGRGAWGSLPPAGAENASRWCCKGVDPRTLAPGAGAGRSDPGAGSAGGTGRGCGCCPPLPPPVVQFADPIPVLSPRQVTPHPAPNRPRRARCAVTRGAGGRAGGRQAGLLVPWSRSGLVDEAAAGALRTCADVHLNLLDVMPGLEGAAPPRTARAWRAARSPAGRGARGAGTAVVPQGAPVLLWAETICEAYAPPA